MSSKKSTARKCRHCGCTQHNTCSHKMDGRTCFWVLPDLCSACVRPAIRKKFHGPLKGGERR